MRIPHAVVLSAAIFSYASSSTLTLHRRQDGAARVLGLDIERRSIANPLLRDEARLRRRAGTLQASLDNEETLYFANVSIGTPTQLVRLHIDTGSSDLWINTPSSSLCSAASDPCSVAGTYAANASSTYDYVDSAFNITYADGTGAVGDYVKDTVTLGEVSLASQQFGIGYTSTSSQGILGIGYELNEAARTAYSNLPASLVAQGYITTNAYSLWLNDLDASTGSILFGGVDTHKFEGTLTTLPIQAESGAYAEFFVTLTGLSLGSTSIAASTAIAVLLDSGTSLTYLPNSWTNSIYSAVGAQYDSSQGAAFVPCSLAANTTATLDFTFSGTTIHVAMSELVLAAGTIDGRPLSFPSGQRACVFGVAPAGSSSSVVLGDTFLRSAYVVYDLANNAVSIAQTAINATSSNVLEIAAGPSGVPSATAAANPVAATAGAAGGSAIIGSTISSSTGLHAVPAASSWRVAVVAALAAALVAPVSRM